MKQHSKQPYSRIVKAIHELKLGRGDLKFHAYAIRKEATFPDLVGLFQIQESLPAESRAAILPNTFAARWSQIAELSLPYRTENLQRSLTCAVAAQASCALVLKNHVAIRSQLEHAILQGDYRDASKILDTHSLHCGKTIWELHWRIVVASQLGGETARDAVTKEIFENSESSILSFITRVYLQLFDQSIPNNLLRASIRSLADRLGDPGDDLIKLLILDELKSIISLEELLNILDLLPIVDRHNLFIRAITHSIVAASAGDAKPLVRALQRLGEHLPWVAVTAEMAYPSEDGYPLSPSQDLRHALDSYVTSDYSNTISNLHTHNTHYAPDMCWLELEVKSSIYLGKAVVEGTNPASWLRSKLSDIFLRTEQVDKAMSELDRFALLNPFVSLSPQIFSIVATYSASEEVKRAESLAALRTAQPVPRLLEGTEQLTRNVSFLSNLHKNNPHSISFTFFFMLAKGELSFEKAAELGVSEIRASFFLALYQYRRKEYSQAVISIERFLDRYRNGGPRENAPFALEEAERLRALIYLKLGDAVLALRSVVEFAYNFPAGIRRIDIPATFRLAKYNRVEASHYIEYPIIAQLSVNDPHEVCLALKHFLRNVGATKPSDLLGITGLNQSLLTELLLRVCTPDVIDSIRGLDTREKVEAERLLLLDWIGGTSHRMSIVADNERLRLIQQGQLRAALDRIDENKVVLNLPNLREAEAQLFDEIYVTYKSHYDLADAKFQSEVTAALKRFQESKNKSIILDTRQVRDPLTNAYATAFRRIRDAFLLSPHFGLEACLSGKIRHGILVEHLLNPLRSRQLLFSRDKNSRIINGTQSNRLNFADCDEGTAKKATIALEKLTSEVTVVAMKVKDKWIQAKTEDKNSDGLFDYSFNAEELKAIFSAQEEDIISKELFIDNIFSVLTLRTSESLEQIRSRVSNELRKSLQNCFNDAIKIVQNLPNMYGLSASLVAAKEDMGNACDELVRWFQSAGGVLSEDVDLELVAVTAAGMLERLHPSVRNKRTISVIENQKIRGRFFDPLVHLVFFLIENGVKHCSPTCEDYVYSVTIGRIDEFIEICVENSTMNNQQALTAESAVNARVAELCAKLDPARVIRDEGSGYAKIIAMLAYEFQQHSPKIVATSRENVLSVKVQAPIKILSP